MSIPLRNMSATEAPGRKMVSSLGKERLAAVFESQFPGGLPVSREAMGPTFAFVACPPSPMTVEEFGGHRATLFREIGRCASRATDISCPVGCRRRGRTPDWLALPCVLPFVAAPSGGPE